MSTVSLIFVGLLLICPFHDAAIIEGQRNSYQMMKMMSSVSKVDDPFKFNGYGNWCGKGGAGEVRDAIDKCCFVHDTCYDELLLGACKDGWFGWNAVLYGKTYDWNYPTETKPAECVDKQEACEAGLCNCDLEFAKCIGENKGVYDKNLRKSSGRSVGDSF